MTTFVILNILYGPPAFLAKLSVLVPHLRLFGVLKRTNIFTWIAIAVNFAQCLAHVVGFAIVYTPALGNSWPLAAANPQRRVVKGLLSVILAVVSVFNDFFIIAIPIPTAWSLQFATRKQIGVRAIFVFGHLLVSHMCNSRALGSFYPVHGINPYSKKQRLRL